MGPSRIETELRSLAPEGGGSLDVMQSFIRMIGSILDSKRDFDLAQAYLALFLKVFPDSTVLKMHVKDVPDVFRQQNLILKQVDPQV